MSEEKNLAVKITEKRCCHWCALGISKDRRKQLLDKINYIAGQTIISGEADVATVLKHISSECDSPEELAAVTWVLGSWAAGIAVLTTVKNSKVVSEALSAAQKIPMGVGGDA